MNEYRFYDTSAFITEGYDIMENNEKFIISIKTVQYLEEHNYDGLIEVLKYYKNCEIYYHPTSGEVVTKFYNIISKYTSPDQVKDIMDSELFEAYCYDSLVHPDETVFITGSLYNSIMANLIFGEDMIELV